MRDTLKKKIKKKKSSCEAGERPPQLPTGPDYYFFLLPGHGPGWPLLTQLNAQSGPICTQTLCPHGFDLGEKMNRPQAGNLIFALLLVNS